MKLNILQLICLINYVSTFPTDLFDELWQTNQSEHQANNNPIKSQPKIKVEPHEEQFDGKWRDEFVVKGNVKVEHEPHYGAVKLKGTSIKHEFEWWGEESREFKAQLADHVKEEDQDGQSPNNSDQKNIRDEHENWEENENNAAPSADDLDQDNFKKNLSDQNISTDQDESVDEQQNECKECDESDQQKREVIQKFREMKEDYTQKRKYSRNEHIQIERKISNGLGVSRATIYKWRKELGLKKETKSKFSESEKRQILKQFDEIKSKCMKAKLKNISKNELDEKIAKKLGVSAKTIYNWKHKFGLSVSNKISDATKIRILKKYAKIKGKNPKMTDVAIAEMLKISISSLKKWKVQFRKEIKNL